MSRREFGALILIAAVLTIKLPGLVGGYREASRHPLGLDAGRAAGPTGWKSTAPAGQPPSPGQDSIRLMAPAAAPAGPAGPDAGGVPSPSNRPNQVPARFFSDPLRFFSSAPPESLIALPGIGPVIAERIAKAASGKGPFTQWEDLLSVKGIGPKKLDKLKRFATQQ